MFVWMGEREEFGENANELWLGGAFSQAGGNIR